LFSSARIITNIDGVEWRREKWQGFAKHFLHFSERVAIRFSHDVIADNEVIANYVQENYGVKSHTIAYGGDHVLDVMNSSIDNYVLPDTFAFSVCRIEPENNVHIIVDAFSRLPSISLVVVGNWDYSEYGRSLREKYASCTNLYLLDSIYDLGKLKQLRSKASMFVHGHSAGGTNPSLVEAMHFGKVIFAFDCNYNRSTTEDKAIYFKSAEELIIAIGNIDPDKSESVGSNMLEIAKRRYTWEIIAKQYFKLLRI
jgi:glycosyltransferase involved in cell wall biosynthesis